MPVVRSGDPYRTFSLNTLHSFQIALKHEANISSRIRLYVLRPIYKDTHAFNKLCKV